MAFLLPHEAIRVLTHRVSQALVWYDPEDHPWKSRRLLSFLDELYIPVILEHHRAEDDLLHELNLHSLAPLLEERAQLSKKLDSLREASAAHHGDPARREGPHSIPAA